MMKVDIDAALTLTAINREYSDRLLREAEKQATMRGSNVISTDDVQAAVRRVAETVAQEYRDQNRSLLEQDDVSIRRAA